MQFILLIKDLVSRTQIKSILPENSDIIGPKHFDINKLPPAKQCIIFLDLESGNDFMLSLATLPQEYKSDSIYCFFPHIRKEIAESAQVAGFKNIMPRSKFFNSLQEIISNVAT